MVEPAGPFQLRLDADDGAPPYLQLERQIRGAIADGLLQPGDRIPSVRSAAADLGLATNTVARAYANLAREGLLLTRPGAGSTVAPKKTLPRRELVRQRRAHVDDLARRVVDRTLALGIAPADVVQSVTREFANRGQAIDQRHMMQVEDEGALLSARNQLRGEILEMRGGAHVVEIRFRIRDGSEVLAVITRSSQQRLGLR